MSRICIQRRIVANVFLFNVYKGFLFNVVFRLLTFLFFFERFSYIYDLRLIHLSIRNRGEGAQE